MANSVDTDQTAPIVCSGSSNVRHLFAADDFSRRHFQMHFFLGVLRVSFTGQMFALDSVVVKPLSSP